ncbi:hypothetical protein NDU88_006615 [Pleurodeles waltl]|uniref:Uncharacterized protein n=1 Tax=Pleurodeles waltl TaxID=8319 RepID=A0AAV7PJ91_PLEWA|nr:hypothetical protein NDU88_006615 [Pleurodeles waltl]
MKELCRVEKFFDVGRFNEKERASRGDEAEKDKRMNVNASMDLAYISYLSDPCPCQSSKASSSAIPV